MENYVKIIFSYASLIIKEFTKCWKGKIAHKTFRHLFVYIFHHIIRSFLLHILIFLFNIQNFRWFGEKFIFQCQLSSSFINFAQHSTITVITSCHNLDLTSWTLREAEKEFALRQTWRNFNDYNESQ